MEQLQEKKWKAEIAVGKRLKIIDFISSEIIFRELNSDTYRSKNVPVIQLIFQTKAYSTVKMS